MLGKFSDKESVFFLLKNIREKVTREEGVCVYEGNLGK